MSKKLTAAKYAEIFNNNRDGIIDDCVEVKQLVNHNPKYFIAEDSRVFCLHGDKIKPVKAFVRDKGNAAKHSKGSNHAKACVEICNINGTGRNDVLYTHRLVGEYFNIDKYIPNSATDSSTIIHHKEGYDGTNHEYSNHKNNLLETTKPMHGILHSVPDIDADEKRVRVFIERLTKAADTEEITVVYGGDKTTAKKLTGREAFDLLMSDNTQINSVYITPRQ